MHRLPSNRHMNLCIHYKEMGIVWKLSNYFLRHIPFHSQKIIFLFIGTDRSTGDALGPLTGSLLPNKALFPYERFGTLEHPLHALNLEETLDNLSINHPDAFIIAIDACLGKVSSIGHFIIQDSPLSPGQALGKKLPTVGDLSIKGVVNISGFMEQAVLQSTRLHLSFEMANILARALYLAHRRGHIKK